MVADPRFSSSLNLASMNLPCGPVATASVASDVSWGVIEVYAPSSDEMYGVIVPYRGGSDIEFGYEFAVWDTPTVDACDDFSLCHKVR